MKLMRDKFGIGSKKRIISAMLGIQTPLMDIMKKYLGPQDYQYVALYRRLNKFDRFNPFGVPFLYDCSPYEWYQIYASVYLNITSFFHGTLLALRSGVPTISFDTTRLGDNYMSKIKQLLTDLDLSDYRFTLGFSPAQEKRFVELIDYTINQRDEVSAKIDSKMDLEKQKSLSFFNKLDALMQ